VTFKNTGLLSLTIEGISLKKEPLTETEVFSVVNGSQSFILEVGQEREIYIYYTPDYSTNFDRATLQVFM